LRSIYCASAENQLLGFRQDSKRAAMFL